MIRHLMPLLALWGLVACTDYNLAVEKEGGNGSDGGEGGSDGGVVDAPDACKPSSFPAEEVGVGDTCPDPLPGGFSPVTEWEFGTGQGCLSQPIVADLDRDGLPELIINLLPNFFGGPGQLTVLRGDGSGLVWQDTAALLAYGSPPAVGDVSGDSAPEIIVVREYASALFAAGDYTAAAYSASGEELWESEHFVGLDFDWATAPVLRDMDHDGNPEVIVGRVILNGEDGSTRGVGAHGRGSYGIVSLGGFTVSESSVPAVTDIDLDGQDEVIVGNAMYDVDGNTLWSDLGQDDAIISVANLDSDPEGEWVGISYNTVRAVDTNGAVLWGPTTVEGANILSPAGIADLNGDGSVEIVTAGGNKLVVFQADGSVLWTTTVTDESGATGASFFDFEGDGIIEVVYIDEIEMAVYDGPTGALKFYSDDHGSNTMFDYPTVADVDADGEAEIIVAHNSFGSAISVYGDADGSWAAARPLWNQHAYDINNVNDDLSIPTTATPGFTTHNTWHSAIADDLGALGSDVSGEVLAVCDDECDEGTVYVTVRVANLADEDLDGELSLALYALTDAGAELAGTEVVGGGLASGFATEGIVFAVDAELARSARSFRVVADDDGAGSGVLSECSEFNNTFEWDGPFCD
jgi:hypothetical protein